MNLNCPNCQALYKVNPNQHLGLRVECRKCGALLTVQTDRLVLASGPDPNFEVPDNAEPLPGPRSRKISFTDRLLESLYAFLDISTWIFAAGAMLAILFLFLPLIDQARIANREAAVSSLELKEKRAERNWNEKKDKTAGEEETRRKEREDYTKEREKLRELVDEATISAKSVQYWYRFGMMLGFLLLALASLGYLSPRQPAIRRVVGAVVILSVIVLIFFVFVIGSAKL